MQSYYIRLPESTRWPILISAPHVGVEFPVDQLSLYTPSELEHPTDTDWFLDQIFAFSESIGIPMIWSRMSRYVVDLNRPPDNRPLYHDGREERGLFPAKTFDGRSIYSKAPPGDILQKRRMEEYYWPYHNHIEERLHLLRRDFGYALLFEAHSIRRQIPAVRPDPFPDLMVGTDDGKTLPKTIEGLIFDLLQRAGYSVSLNDPFKGGFLTRKNGKIKDHLYAVQLEMCQDLYLTPDRKRVCKQKHAKLSKVLEQLFFSLGENLAKLSR